MDPSGASQARKIIDNSISDKAEFTELLVRFLSYLLIWKVGVLLALLIFHERVDNCGIRYLTVYLSSLTIYKIICILCLIWALYQNVPVLVAPYHSSILLYPIVWLVICTQSTWENKMRNKQVYGPYFFNIFATTVYNVYLITSQYSGRPGPNFNPRSSTPIQSKHTGHQRPVRLKVEATTSQSTILSQVILEVDSPCSSSSINANSRLTTSQNAIISSENHRSIQVHREYFEGHNTHRATHYSSESKRVRRQDLEVLIEDSPPSYNQATNSRARFNNVIPGPMHLPTPRTRRTNAPLPSYSEAVCWPKPAYLFY